MVSSFDSGVPRPLRACILRCSVMCWGHAQSQRHDSPRAGLATAREFLRNQSAHIEADICLRAEQSKIFIVTLCGSLPEAGPGSDVERAHLSSTTLRHVCRSLSRL
jgi:hypothetical protein